MSETRDKLLALMPLELALDDMGIYPQACVIDGVEKKRTKWEDGWNAYGMELVKKWSRLSKWMQDIPAEHKTDVENFLIDGTLFLSTNGEDVSLMVNSSDLFAWGYSDSDEVKFEDLPEFKKAIADSPKHGGILWICRREKLRPQKPYYKYFSDEEKRMFDTCGEKHGWGA